MKWYEMIFYKRNMGTQPSRYPQFKGCNHIQGAGVPDPTITLAELDVHRVDGVNTYKGTLEVKWNSIYPCNAITKPTGYSEVIFIPCSSTDGDEQLYTIENFKAKFELITGNHYQLIYLDGTQYEFIVNTDNRTNITRFRQAIGTKPITQCGNFGIQIHIYFMFKLIYNRTLNKTSYKGNSKFKPEGIPLPASPIIQMIVLALMDMNVSKGNISLDKQAMKIWWEKHRLDPQPSPRPQPSRLQDCLKNPDLIYAYWD
jgi:hypothetical protein